MRDGIAYRVTFGNDSPFDIVAAVVSFDGGDDAIKLARMAADCFDLPPFEVECVGNISVDA